MIDQGWMVDDGPAEDDYWDDDPYDDREPDEPDPDCCRFGTCWWCKPHVGRDHRKLARIFRMQRQRQQKIIRHANDRFWQARNRPAFDDEAPF